VKYFLLAATVALIAFGQIMQKLAAEILSDSVDLTSAIRRLLRSTEFWLAAMFLSLGIATWLITLTSFEVSTAYPLLSMSFVATALLSRWILYEKIGLFRWLGIGLICSGAALMLQD